MRTDRPRGRPVNGNARQHKASRPAREAVPSVPERPRPTGNEWHGYDGSVKRPGGFDTAGPFVSAADLIPVSSCTTQRCGYLSLLQFSVKLAFLDSLGSGEMILIACHPEVEKPGPPMCQVLVTVWAPCFVKVMV